MPPTDKNAMDNEPKGNDPKGNDPIHRDLNNEEIVAYLQRGSMHFCPVLKRHVGQACRFFEFRTDFFQGMPHHFQAMFMHNKDIVLCTTTAEEFDKYPRANALKSLLHGKCFPDVEAFAVACRNALGDNIETFELAGCIFVDDKCVDEILDALLEEPAPAEDKTDEKELASPAEDKTEDKELELTDEELENAKKFTGAADGVMRLPKVLSYALEEPTTKAGKRKLATEVAMTIARISNSKK